MRIYEGKGSVDKGTLLGVNVVNNALDACAITAGKHVFFDNFFTSIPLIENLKKKQIKATGTIRDDRLMGCPIESKPIMAKKERGDFDYRSTKDLMVIRWNDNSVVTICSNSVGVRPLFPAKRWVKGRGKVLVGAPNAIKAYNSSMGGVDLLDQALAKFRPAIIGKKWYFPLLTNALNIGLVYAWRLFQILKDSSVPEKKFLRVVVDILLRSAVQKTAAGALRPGPALTTRQEIRFDNVGHLPTTIETPRRCVYCGKTTRKKCEKCNKSLHLDFCFQMYHQEG